jgi:hypothetical protein
MASANTLRHVIVSFVGASIASGAMLFFAFPSADVPPPPPPAVPLPPLVTAPPRPDPAVLRAKFYDEAVQPQIAATDALNRDAADRCIARVGRLIDGYRRGVDPFVEDLTSISTRLGIVRRMPTDWWYEDQGVSLYVQGKFESHLFSEAKLTSDIAAVLNQFRGEVDANQRRMLTDIQAALTTADLPEVNLDAYEPFFAKVASDMQTYSTGRGATSVARGITTLVVSEAGGFVAVSVVGSLLARFTLVGATTVAAGATATAGTTAVGAGGGSLAGPAGTAVGFVVGLGVGLAIDWYLTDQFQLQLSSDMTGYLDALEHTLLHGQPKRSQSGQSESGLIEALPTVCDELRAAYRERFYQQIVQTEITK